MELEVSMNNIFPLSKTYASILTLPRNSRKSHVLDVSLELLN